MRVNTSGKNQRPGKNCMPPKRGKRGKRGPSDWNKKVMAQWAKMKPKGHSFSDALKETSRLRKAGLI